MADHVDLVLRQWGARRPDLDVSPMAVIGRLSRLSRLIGSELSQTFAAHGLDRASFDVLATLRRSGPEHRLTPAALMRSAMVTSGAVTQRLDRLQARGLVTRTPSESDGRVVHVSLTREGLELVDRVLPDHLATEDRVLGALDEAGRRTLAGLLRDLLESLGDTLPVQSAGYAGPLSYENEFCEKPSQDFSCGPLHIEYAGHGAAQTRRGGGRPKVIDDDMLATARALRDQGVPVSEIAGRLTIKAGKNAGRHPSVASLYRALAE
ncbi:MarR family transcriptional regulator [Streptomyces sp. NPDC018833]|uniref:MarR family transcriptional regulator n=1 Tax=Streptomyces sp. NPDC018833 TaxID=3365053 RepID=UPI0037B11262